MSLAALVLFSLAFAHLALGVWQLWRRHDLDVRPLLWGLAGATALIGLSIVSLAEVASHQATLDMLGEARQVLLSADVWMPSSDRLACLCVLGGQLVVNGVVGQVVAGRQG